MQVSWVEYITAFGSVATPLLVVALSAIGWRIKSSIERRIDLEKQLREDRVEIYNKILEPFIIIFTPDVGWAQDRRNKNKTKHEVAESKMLSFEYRDAGFKMSLIGSDAVVKSYNDLMQHFFNSTNHDPNDRHLQGTREMLRLLGTLLLEIRKSMGNDDTGLDCWDMCEWWMSDARKLRDGEVVA